jgi:hypothetical protein
MSQSPLMQGDVFSTPASSMYLGQPDGAASTSASTASPREHREDSDNWTSSSGETSSLIQRKTVKKEFTVGSPRTVKRSNASSSSATVTPKRRRDVQSPAQTTPRARDGRTTPLVKLRSQDIAKKRGQMDYYDDSDRKATRSNRGYNNAGWTGGRLQLLGRAQKLMYSLL